MTKKPIPLEEIGQILNEVMDLAVKNGANSISMPDEYVAVAHFLCYPEEYCLPEKHTIACRAVGGGTNDDYCICPKG